MLFRKKDTKDASFYGVAGFIIVFGTFMFSLGIVEWLFNFFTFYTFGYPMHKILVGIVILALGYILLELELMRGNK